MANLVKATLAVQSAAGFFRIFVAPPSGPRVEITTFRGAPINITSAAFSDPFSEETAVLAAPQISPFEQLGVGDLWWLVEGADIDIVWQNLSGSPFDYEWSWEGFITSFDFGISGGAPTFNIQLKGALLALDNYLAIPAFPANPLPYEFLIRSAFDPEQHPCSLNPIRITFPDNWSTIAPASNDPDYANPLLRPYGVLTGQNWTGLTSRSTGSWNPLLSGFVASLLQVMYTADGSQWTITNQGGRSPQMYVRERPSANDPSILNLDLGAPGVDFSLSKDYSQAINVLYGSGTDTAGVAYSGLVLSPDGLSVSYQPFAANPMAYPRNSDQVINPLYDPRRKVRESYVAFQQGLSQAAAQAVAQGQLQRFNDPGMTGTITLKSSPYLSDDAQTPYYHMLIKAGQTIRLKGVLGNREGMLFHVTEVSLDFAQMSATLTVDSKYRDTLTVAEVYARTRDPLATLHTLQNSAQSNTVQDLLLPWSYADGSGSLPYSATGFYAQLPSDAAFPYTDFTTKFPPSTHPEYYIHIGPTDLTDSRNNWAVYDNSAFTGVAGGQTSIVAIPVLMSQKGTAALTQIAAYDRDGNVLPVKFHLSFYTSNGVQIDDMPQWSLNPFLQPQPGGNYPPKLDNTNYIDYSDPRMAQAWQGKSINYDPWAGETPDPPSPPTVGQTFPHPFFAGAWQATDEQGHTLTGSTSGNYQANSDAGLVIGWGTYYEPAGFWPGQPPSGKATGMMQDSTAWQWDTSATLNAQSVNPAFNSPTGYMNMAGALFAMIYCEDQGQQDVYFMARVYVSPQTGS